MYVSHQWSVRPQLQSTVANKILFEIVLFCNILKSAYIPHMWKWWSLPARAVGRPSGSTKKKQKCHRTKVSIVWIGSAKEITGFMTYAGSSLKMTQLIYISKKALNFYYEYVCGSLSYLSTFSSTSKHVVRCIWMYVVLLEHSPNK